MVDLPAVLHQRRLEIGLPFQLGKWLLRQLAARQDRCALRLLGKQQPKLCHLHIVSQSAKKYFPQRRFTGFERCLGMQRGASNGGEHCNQHVAAGGD